MSTETNPALNPALPQHPRQVMAPGWYWKLLEPAEAGAVWTQFTRNHPEIRTVKTRGVGDAIATLKGSWVLFQVTGSEPVRWTLPGLPSKAPKGAATEYEDTVESGEPTPSGTDLLEELLGGLHEKLGQAGTVLLWGGTALLLWQLAQFVRPLPSLRSRS